MPRQNEWWYQVWMRQKFEHKRIQNETTVTLPLKKSLNQQVMIRSLRESWIWRKILVGIMNHWGKNDRNHEYQDSNDSASTPRRDQLILFNAPLPWQTQYIASFQLQRYVFFILYHKLNWKVLANIFFICHTKLKCGGRITPSSNRQDSNILINGTATIFFSLKKKKLFEGARQKRKAKKSWITVPFVKDIRSFSPSYVRFLEFFFTFY